MLPLRLRIADCPSAEGVSPCATCVARELSVCASLSLEGLSELAALARVSRFEAGASLAAEGEAVTEVFNLTSGSAVAFRLLEDGRRQILDFLFPGDVFGPKAGATYPYEVAALEPVTACRFRLQEYAALMDRFPDLEAALADRMAEDLRAARAQLVVLGRLTAPERVAAFLTDFAGRATPGPDGAFDLPMSRMDIADYLGLTLETVSRSMSSLKARGILELPSPRRVRLNEPERLARLAGRD